MSTRAKVEAALERLSGKTILAAAVVGRDTIEGPIECILIETVEGDLVEVETRHHRGVESWLEVPK